MSIDETRRPFAQCLVPPVPPPGAQEPVVAEAWFAGIHSDVGGGVDNNPGLGNVSMRWVLDAAIDAGLIVHAQRYKRRYTLQEADARQPKHRNGWKWVLTGYKRRVIPPGARIHASVKTRAAHPECKYRSWLPATFEWEDEQWVGPPR